MLKSRNLVQPEDFSIKEIDEILGIKHVDKVSDPDIDLSKEDTKN